MRGRRKLPRLLGLVIAIGGMAAALLPVEGQTPKRGGIRWGRMQDVWLDK